MYILSLLRYTSFQTLITFTLYHYECLHRTRNVHQSLLQMIPLLRDNSKVANDDTPPSSSITTV